MKIKKIISLGLAGCIILGGSAYSLANNDNVIRNVKEEIIIKQNSQRAIIETKVINQKTDLYELNIKIPVIKGLSNVRFQEDLNHKILTSALAHKKVITDEAKEYAEEAKKAGYDVRHFELVIDYDVKSTDDFLSFVIYNYTYTGGAHGITIADYYNIDLTNPGELGLKDFFKDDTNFKDVITKEIKEQMRLQELLGEDYYYFKDDEAENSDYSLKSISDQQAFYLQDNNLVVCFGHYEIAPYAAVLPEFKIPLADLKDILKDEFKKASLQLSTKKIYEKNNSVEIEMRLPVVEGLKNKAKQENLNKKIMDNALNNKKEVEKAAKELEIYAKKNKQDIVPYQLFGDYSIKSQGDILSFTTTTYSFTGGANGALEAKYYNIDTKTGNDILLKDLFKEKSNFKEILNKEISTQIDKEREEGRVFFEGEIGFKSISDTQSFYIKDGNLVICFEMYEIAPRSEGIVEFEIPIEKLKNILR